MSEFYAGDLVTFEVPGERRTAQGVVVKTAQRHMIITSGGQLYCRPKGGCAYVSHALCQPCGDAWDNAYHQERSGTVDEWRKKLNDDCAAITLNCRQNHPKVVNL